MSCNPAAESVGGCHGGWACAPERPGRRPFVRLFGAAVALVVLASIAYAAFRNWAALWAYEWRVRPTLLVCSVLGLAVARCLGPLGVWRVLRLFGKRAPLHVCWRVYALSQFAKYVPGGVWLFLARAYLYSRYGVARAAAAVLVAVEQALLIAGGMVVFLAVLPWTPWLGRSLWFWVCPAALLALLLGLHPRVLAWVYGLVAHRADGERVEVRMSYRGVLGLLLLYVVLWVVAGFAFALLVAAVIDLPVHLWPAAGGMFAGACSVGFLVFVTPAGLGVREGGLAAFLSLVVPFPVAAALALLARLWWFVVDVVFSGASLAVLAVMGRRAGAAAGGGTVRAPREGACGNLEEAGE